MKKISEPVAFFGSGPVAAKALELLQASFDIEAIITKPRPSHHKEAFPVLEIAEKYNIPTLTARTKNELNELFAHTTLQSRLAILVDYGIIVSQAAIDYFPLGIVNSHFSLLPEWRGADPITFAILSGQEETGVSLMLLVEAMDEGPLLAQAPYTLSADTTTPELTQDLILLSDRMLQEIIPEYLNGSVQPAPQEVVALSGHETPSYSRKLTKEDGVLDWQKPATQLECEIRAFIEWPKSRTRLAGKDVIITKAHAVPTNSPDKKPGDVEVVKDISILMVECAEGSLCIDTLKPAGKSEMTAKAFLAGYGQRLQS